MAEIAFAKQFLSTLDSRSIKLPGDYVADPKTLPAQPAYILPRTPKPYPSRAQRQQIQQAQSSALTSTPTSRPGQTSSDDISVTLSPLRPLSTIPGPVTISLPKATLSKTSIYDIKTELGKKTGYEVSKLKILNEKRPVTDSKTLAEIAGDGVAAVALQVMYMGTASSKPLTTGAEAVAAASNGVKEGSTDARVDEMDVDETPVAQGKSGEEILSTEAFWADLKGFVEQRIRNELVAARAVNLWKKASIEK